MSSVELGTAMSEKCSNSHQSVIIELELPKPPDGGYGWVIVAACFVANMIVDGTCYAFGIYLSDLSNHFHSSKGTTALAGSLLAGIYMLSGPISSGLSNKFGSKIIMIVGAFISTGAFFVSVWSPSIVHFLLLYGLVGGIGFGLIYLPAVVAPANYFEQRRAVATGIAVAGSGVGTFVFAPLVRVIIKAYGWQGSIWILAGIILNCVVCGALLRPLSPYITPRLVQQKSEDTVHIADDSHRRSARSSQIGLELRPRIRPKRLRDTLSYRDYNVSGGKQNIDEEFRKTNEARYGRLGLQSGAVSSHLALAKKFPIDTRSPFSRSDIFYTASIQHLPEFQQSRQDIDVYRQRQSSYHIPIPQRARRSDEVTMEDEDDPEHSAGTVLSCLPAPIRDVMAEMFNFTLLRDPNMMMLALANSAGMCAFYVPFVYMVDRAETVGIDPARASLLLSVTGVFNTGARVFFGWLADQRYISALNIVNGSLTLSGIVTILFPLVTNYWLIAAYAAIFGFFISPFISLTSIYLVDYFGLENLTNSFGLLILFRGVFVMIGSPIGGAVYDLTGSYATTFYFAGSLMLVSAALGFLVTGGDRILSWFHQTTETQSQHKHASTNVDQYDIIRAYTLTTESDDSGVPVELKQ